MDFRLFYYEIGELTPPVAVESVMEDFPHLYRIRSRQRSYLSDYNLGVSEELPLSSFGLWPL